MYLVTMLPTDLDTNIGKDFESGLANLDGVLAKK